MSMNLNNDVKFRLIDNNNNDVTTKSSLDPNKVKLQVDTDKDGKFDGANDITIDDKVVMSKLLDETRGNIPAIKSLPFIDQVEDKMLISGLLQKAEKFGKESEDTSIFKLDKKISLGKVAFSSTQKAFEINKADPDARFSYGAAILGVHNSSFKSTAEKSLGINLNNLTNDLISELKKDKQDITGQLVLSRLYEATGNDQGKSEAQQNLSILKNKFPTEYKRIESELNKALQ